MASRTILIIIGISLLLLSTLTLGPKGSDAFSTATVSRNEAVNVTTDTNSIIRFAEPTEANNDFLYIWSDSEIEITLDSTATTHGGQGPNGNASFYMDEVLNVTNNADQTLWFQFLYSDDGLEGGNHQVRIWFYPSEARQKISTRGIPTMGGAHQVDNTP